MVITLDKHKKPLGVCTERRARILLTKRRACVYRYYPFTIIIKDIDVRDIQPKEEYQIKIDPGSKYTGIAVVRTNDNAVVFYQQIEHRGAWVKSNLDTRRATRRNRRNRETRYRRSKWGAKQLKKGKNPGYKTNAMNHGCAFQMAASRVLNEMKRSTAGGDYIFDGVRTKILGTKEQ